MFGSKDKSRRKLEEKIIQALGQPDWLESVTIGEDGRVVLVIKAGPAQPEAAEARRPRRVLAPLLHFLSQ